MPLRFAVDAFGFAGGKDGVRHGRTDGIAESDVADDAVAEESGDAKEGAVDELIGNDEVAGLVLFFQRADGGDGENALDAELLQRINIGAEIQLRGKDAVAAAVPGEEGDLAALEIAEDESIAGIAEGRRDTHFMDVGEAGHGVEPAASDDADFRLLQYGSPRGTLRRRRVRESGTRDELRAGSTQGISINGVAKRPSSCRSAP